MLAHSLTHICEVFVRSHQFGVRMADFVGDNTLRIREVGGELKGQSGLADQELKEISHGTRMT